MTDQEVVNDGEKLMRMCFTSVEKILGRKPSNEEIALVNSLFIYSSKELYFRSRRG